MREQRAKAAQHLARRREQEELARAQMREEEARRATLRKLVGKYVALEARRKLRAYQSEQQKRVGLATCTLRLFGSLALQRVENAPRGSSSKSERICPEVEYQWACG